MSSEEKNLLLAIVGDLSEVFGVYWSWACPLPRVEDQDRQNYLMLRERHRVIKKLLGDRPSWDSSRYFEFLEVGDYCSDEIHISLYSNGIGALYWSKGNIDHSSNDHRIGLFEENGDVIELKSISLWRECDNIATHSFRKLEDGSLLYLDQDPVGRLVESKVLKQRQNKVGN